ncbi:GNAT family N-acetyltransferase [Saccharibacillus sp. VR-M41]|uniref:GNAT family N-acetyltransferase n=2 Tax=Saccharibacillus alkalitolerans TaxID=2705290 RepID=A0ABX0F873_9BACL|nr:GNAT family N-acetyltransferase [Saccharibacillus alkalitolerans]
MYEFRDFDAYWNEPGRYPFLLRADGKLAGFALIRLIGPSDEGSSEKADGLGIYEMVEFFVMKKYRKQGIGRRAADELFRRFPGRWKLGVMEENAPALSFWREAIASCEAAEKLLETREREWDGPMLRFTVRKSAE